MIEVLFVRILSPEQFFLLLHDKKFMLVSHLKLASRHVHFMIS